MELHSKNINQKIDQFKADIENRMDKRFKQVDDRLKQIDSKIDKLDKKFTGAHAEIMETQETVDFLLSKVVQHKKKIRATNESLEMNHTSLQDNNIT